MNIIGQAIETLHVYRTLKRQNITAKFKKQILRDYFRCIVFKRFRPNNNTFRLLDYNINYCLYDAFSYVFSDIFINNEYYFKSTTNSPSIIDCGSNIGLSVLYFKHLYPAAKIIAFEPDIDAFTCLEKNVNENRLSDIIVHNNAVSRENGTLKFSYNADRPGAITSTTETTDKTTTRDVEAVKLSDYINTTVDFMKMDIEGAETDVFHDLHDNDKLKHIDQLILEYHHHIGSKMDRLSEILSILEKENFGYRLHCNDQDNSARTEPQLVMLYAYKK